MRKENRSIYRITFTAVMAAIVCVVTFLRFPLLGSKVHFANAMCLLSGMLLGPVFGGLAASHDCITLCVYMRSRKLNDGDTLM